MHDKIIVGLGFTAQVGKDTIADYLVKEHRFRKTSFATALKEAARAIFGFTDEQLYGPKEVKEAVDEFWDKRLSIAEITYTDGSTRLVCDFDEKWKFHLNHDHIDSYKKLPVTPRLCLQLLGTEAGRNVFGQCLWVETVARRIENSGHPRWVIPDVRFPNEANAVLKWDGTAWAVEASYPGYIGISGGVSAHASETSLLTFDRWSGTIGNHGTFTDLYREVENNIVSMWR